MATAPHSLALPNLPAPQGLGTRSAVMGGSLGDSAMQIVYRQASVFTSASASWDIARREVETATALSDIRTACAAVTAAGAGRIKWTRVSESDESGKDRLPGQFDGRSVLKLHVSPNVTKAGKVMVTVILAATDVNPVRTVHVRAETLLFVKA
jgi:hypothetical protein